jgi:chromosome segregation ATPase
MTEQDDKRFAALENRLSEADRLAKAEARLAGHDAMFAERGKAEIQAQRERELSAAAVQKALEEAAKSMAENLVAALKAADSIELERVGRVRDEIEGIKATRDLLSERRQVAQNKFENQVADNFHKVNDLRGALEELGKGMATRRELEVGLASMRAEREQLVASNNAVVDEHTRQLGELRTLVAVGPSGLPELQAHTNQEIGAKAGADDSGAHALAAGAALTAQRAVTAAFVAGAATLGLLIFQIVHG